MEPYIAEVRIWAGNFAPRGWAFCNGGTIPIATSTALFSLIGTTYGGDGRTTMGLPDLRGRAPMHPGHGPGLTPRRLGQKVGVPTVILFEAQMPQHRHTANVSLAPGDDDDPRDDAVLAAGPTNATLLYAPKSTAHNASIASQALPHAGGSQQHDNMQPYLALNFIIALEGEYPPRS